MISEKVYRALLVIYPKEYRREYADLMVQMFRDRMRHDGGGFRAPIIWTQMMLDLAVSAIEEHRRGADMKKRVWIATASLVALLIVAAGVSFVLSQSNDEIKLNEEVNMRVFVWNGFSAFSAEGKKGITDVLQHELKEDVTIQESETEITLSFGETEGFVSFEFRELPTMHTILPDDGDRAIFVTAWRNSDDFPPEADELRQVIDDYADDLRGMVEDGWLDQEEADRTLVAARRGNTILLEEWD